MLAETGLTVACLVHSKKYFLTESVRVKFESEIREISLNTLSRGSLTNLVCDENYVMA